MNLRANFFQYFVLFLQRQIQSQYIGITFYQLYGTCYIHLRTLCMNTGLCMVWFISLHKCKDVSIGEVWHKRLFKQDGIDIIFYVKAWNITFKGHMQIWFWITNGWPSMKGQNKNSWSLELWLLWKIKVRSRDKKNCSLLERFCSDWSPDHQ